ncbi:centrosomal protein of 57 kDa-like isoform X2 [Mytilus galloprovincialis]|uniref:centrosomal protein of 57 kDa-like isoform X2 n=1 Tax=Mytilus galloprovincialis TaxID=29158 RepID=UPI003F7B640E
MIKTFSPHMGSLRSPTKRPLYRNQDESFALNHDNTLYHEYPNKPFINDDYRQTKPTKAYPENNRTARKKYYNRTAVISALKNLQDKIRKLELERGAAEDNLKSLAIETNKYRDILQRDRDIEEPRQSAVSKNTQGRESDLPFSSNHVTLNLHQENGGISPKSQPSFSQDRDGEVTSLSTRYSLNSHPDVKDDARKMLSQSRELESQLSSAETRSQLLEKQLDYMRKMVQNAESDRQDAMVTNALMKTKDRYGLSTTELKDHDHKISDLEREHLKLTATQTLSENKIRELEEKLQEEKHHRKLLEEKAVELETMAATNRILMEADLDEPSSKSKPKRPAKKKKKVVAKSGKRHCSDPTKHYRLNLAEIPFVAGTSLTPSHSVGGNVQRVLALMKSHNMALCSELSDNRSSSPSSGSSNGSLNNDLADLLLQLQDEFGHMSFEHQEISNEINEATDHKVREDLERELEALVSRMEAKSQQISKVRKHQQKLEEKKKKMKKRPNSAKQIDSKETTPRTKSSCSNYSSGNGEVEVTTTIRTKGSNVGKVQVRPHSGHKVSLNVLKDMKKLQTTLRKDDLKWE